MCRWLCVSALLLAILTPFPGETMVAAERSLSSIAHGADAIVVGRVTALSSISRDGYAWTLVTIAIEKSVKGQASGNLVLRIPGGEQLVNGRTLVTRVAGVPRLEMMEKGIFFLSGRAPQLFQLTDWHEGYRRVELQKGMEMTTDGSNAMPAQNFLERVSQILKHSDWQ